MSCELRSRGEREGQCGTGREVGAADSACAVCSADAERRPRSSGALSTGIGDVASGLEEETWVGSEMTSFCLSSSSSSDEQQPPMGGAPGGEEVRQLADVFRQQALVLASSHPRLVLVVVCAARASLRRAECERSASRSTHNTRTRLSSFPKRPTRVRFARSLGPWLDHILHIVFSRGQQRSQSRYRSREREMPLPEKFKIDSLDKENSDLAAGIAAPCLAYCSETLAARVGEIARESSREIVLKKCAEQPLASTPPSPPRAYSFAVQCEPTRTRGARLA